MVKCRKKRTISLEHLKKMQDGRKKKAIIKKRIANLEEKGLMKDVPMGYNERLLSGLRRTK